MNWQPYRLLAQAASDVICYVWYNVNPKAGVWYPSLKLEPFWAPQTLNSNILSSIKTASLWFIPFCIANVGWSHHKNHLIYFTSRLFHHCLVPPVVQSLKTSLHLVCSVISFTPEKKIQHVSMRFSSDIDI